MAKESKLNEDEKTCKGCMYENAELSSPAISNCVGCKRIIDIGKHDYYKKKKVKRRKI